MPLRDRLRYVSWAAVFSACLMVASVPVVVFMDDSLGVVLGLGSISWALLSMNDDSMTQRRKKADNGITRP